MTLVGDSERIKKNELNCLLVLFFKYTIVVMNEYLTVRVFLYQLNVCLVCS